jgi:hemoglobin
MGAIVVVARSKKNLSFGEMACGRNQRRATVTHPDSSKIASANTGDTLYGRLGGYDAIAAAVADLMPRLRSDPKLWVYWKGKSVESRRRGDQLLIDFLCAAFGGPVYYDGPDMKTSHHGLGITNEEWDLTLGHIGATLDALGVAVREKAEVLAAAASLKDDIVEA